MDTGLQKAQAHLGQGIFMNSSLHRVNPRHNKVRSSNPQETLSRVGKAKHPEDQCKWMLKWSVWQLVVRGRACRQGAKVGCQQPNSHCPSLLFSLDGTSLAHSLGHMSALFSKHRLSQQVLEMRLWITSYRWLKFSSSLFQAFTTTSKEICHLTSRF